VEQNLSSLVLATMWQVIKIRIKLFLKSKAFRNIILAIIAISYICWLIYEGYIPAGYLCLAPMFLFLIGSFITLYLKEQSKRL
jgi:hypothetical protein